MYEFVELKRDCLLATLCYQMVLSIDKKPHFFVVLIKVTHKITKFQFFTRISDHNFAKTINTNIHMALVIVVGGIIVI